VTLCPTLHFDQVTTTLNLAHAEHISLSSIRKLSSIWSNRLLSSVFAGIILLNGHGGTVSRLCRRSVTSGTTARSRIIALATYWEMGGAAFADCRRWNLRRFRNACEYETSMMLHLFPAARETQRARRASRPGEERVHRMGRRCSYRGVTMASARILFRITGGSGSRSGPRRQGPASGREGGECRRPISSIRSKMAMMRSLKHGKKRN